MEKDAAVPVEKLQMKISKYNKRKENSDCRLIGEHVPVNEAREIWPDRFDAAKARDAGAAFLQVRRHYTIAPVDDQIYHLGDCCHIKRRGYYREGTYQIEVSEVKKLQGNMICFRNQ